MNYSLVIEDIGESPPGNIRKKQWEQMSGMRSGHIMTKDGCGFSRR